jgi:hypothetical protein
MISRCRRASASLRCSRSARPSPARRCAGRSAGSQAGRSRRGVRAGGDGNPDDGLGIAVAPFKDGPRTPRSSTTAWKAGSRRPSIGRRMRRGRSARRRRARGRRAAGPVGPVVAGSAWRRRLTASFPKLKLRITDDSSIRSYESSGTASMEVPSRACDQGTRAPSCSAGLHIPPAPFRTRRARQQPAHAREGARAGRRRSDARPGGRRRPHDKERARAQIIVALREQEWSSCSVSLRINGLDTHRCYRDT